MTDTNNETPTPETKPAKPTKAVRAANAVIGTPTPVKRKTKEAKPAAKAKAKPAAKAAAKPAVRAADSAKIVVLEKGKKNPRNEGGGPYLRYQDVLKCNGKTVADFLKLQPKWRATLARAVKEGLIKLEDKE
jgi:hypothetical protein